MLPHNVFADYQLVAAIQAIVLGVMGFAVLHHLLIGVRRPGGDALHLTFAATCAMAFWWALWGVARYTAPDPEALAVANTARESIGTGVGLGILWFLALYSGERPKRFLWTVSALHVVYVVANEMMPYGLAFSGPPQLNFYELPWGETLTGASQPRGWYYYLTAVLPLTDFGFGFWAAWRMWRRGLDRQALYVFAALLLLFLGIGNFYDLLFGPVPNIEIAFLGLIMVMSLATSNQVVEASVVRDALAQSEERLRTLVENAPESVLLLDGVSGEALEANDSALELFQIQRSRMKGLRPAHMAPAQQDEQTSDSLFEHRVGDALKGGRPIFRWVVRGQQGREVPCEARLVRLPGSEPVMVRLSLIDLQELEDAERRQAELETQLRQSQRLEAVGRLTGGVAHDFNNYLTVVQGNLEMLLEDGLNEADRELVMQALSAANRSGELTKRLLAFSRRQPLEPRPVELSDLHGGLIELLSRTLGEHVRLELSVPAGLWVFDADPSQLESAVLNLAINARDAMPMGGKLLIEALNLHVTGDEVDWRADVAPGEYVAIVVTDEGEGMDPGVARRAVEPFFSTKGVGKGSGLGLSMVYGFVTQSGGALHIDSAPGEGTGITMLFPRSLSPVSSSPA